MDEKRRWMAEEISQWGKEGLIDRAQEKVLLRRYGGGRHTDWLIPGFMGMAAFCFFLMGSVLLATSVWADLSQAGQFWWASAPLLLSLVLWAAVSLMKKPGILLREMTGLLYGCSLCAAIGLVHESYELSPDLYPLALWGALFLLPAVYLLRSAGVGILYITAACAVSFWSPLSGWVEGISWILMALAFPLIFFFAQTGKSRQLLLFSWGWAGGAAYLITVSVSGIIWQILAYSVMAALFLLGGVCFPRLGILALSMRTGGILFLGLVFLAACSGQFWEGMTSFSWYAAVLTILLLAAVSAGAWIMFQRKEYVCAAVSLAPWMIAAAAAAYAVSGMADIPVSILSLSGLLGAAGFLLQGIRKGKKLIAAGGGAWMILWSAVRLSDSSFSYADKGLYFMGAAVLLVILAAAAVWSRRRNLSSFSGKGRTFP